jgi:ATP-binding cassette subfamily B protein
MVGERALLREKLGRFAAQLRLIPRTVALVWQAAGGWLVAWTALLILQGILPVVVVYLTRALVNRLASWVTQSSPADFGYALPVLLGLVGVLILSELLSSAAGYVRTIQAERLKDRISDLVHAQSASVDLAFYEWPEFHDHLHRAQSEAAYRPVMLLDSLGGLLQHGITLVAMGAALVPYGVWLPLVLLASTLPAFWTVLHYSLLQHELRQRTTADERRTRYFSWLVTTASSAAEIRLFQLADLFQTSYRQVRSVLQRDALRLAGKQLVTEAFAALAALAVMCLTLGWMVWRVAHGTATLGDLAFFYQAFQQGQRMMHALVRQLAQLYYNSLFLSDLFEFLALQPTITSPQEPRAIPKLARAGVTFDNVTFHYPGGRRAALANFSLHLPAQKIVALVGPNGAGKSTIAKLMCRLYDPAAGRILYEGVDLAEFSLEDYRRKIAVLFQTPVEYSANVAETIAYGQAGQPPCAERIEAAAQAAGAAEIIDELPAGYHQQLGSWFASGTQLSVGQWQRLALARALYRDAELLILDEPTSAMDPWAEGEWLARLRQATVGKTVVIITHRLTTAMHTDLIHVLDAGRLVESGDHHELLRLDGQYAAAWRLQASPVESAS